MGCITLPLVAFGLITYNLLSTIINPPLSPCQQSLSLINKDGSTFNVSWDFIQWLTGFADAEGNFHISLKAWTGNIFDQCQLTFQIGLHIDDIGVLRTIQSKLSCGNITISRDKCNYYVSDIYSLYSIILPVFDAFGLNSSKIHFYAAWRKAVLILHSGSHLTQAGRLQLVTLRLAIQALVVESMPNTNFNITPQWLLGFIEGDASFSTNNLVPRLKFENSIGDNALLLVIKAFLGVGNMGTSDRQRTAKDVRHRNKLIN